MANNGSESEKAVKEVGFKFAKNQRVFCNHVTMMYEARIMDQEMRETIPCYLVHYHGWNKNWDEWVEEGRLVDYNDKNFKLAEELRVNFKVNKDSSQPKSTKRKSMSAMLSLTPSSSNYSVVVEKEGNDPKSGGNGKDGKLLLNQPMISITLFSIFFSGNYSNDYDEDQRRRKTNNPERDIER